jgi:hypothetical protein
VARRAMPQVRGREQRRGTRNRAARPQRAGSNKCTNQKMLGFSYKEVGRTQTGFGRSPCCRPATDQPPLVSCPRATRPQPRSADGATEGPSADGGYDGSESASRQANSREKADSAQRGTLFAETQSFRRGTHFAEKVLPFETVTDKSRRTHFATSVYSSWINALSLTCCSAYAVQTANRGRLGNSDEWLSLGVEA